MRWCFLLFFHIVLSSQEDTLFKKRINISFDAQLLIPQTRSKSELFNGNAPNVDHSVFTSNNYLKTYNFRSNPYSISLIASIKVENSIYFQTGVSFLQFNEQNIITGDSLRTYNGKHVNSIALVNNYQYVFIPTYLQYRIDKHFFLNFDLLSGIYSTNRTNYLTPELVEKNNYLSSFALSVFRVQSLCASINLFNSRRCYFDLRVTHSNLDNNSAYTKFKDNLYYSLGIKIFAL
jgi:hypothetical protein